MNKAIKNIMIKITMLIGLGFFVFLVVVAKINRDETKVKQIRVSINEWNGNFFVTKSQILNLIESKFEVINRIPTGKILERIEETVNRIPQVNKSNAFTDNQGNLNIKIEQRKPLVRVYNLQGQSFYLDENGIKFQTSNYFTARVPVVTGSLTETCDSVEKIQSTELKRIYNVVGTINKNLLWKQMIGQYNINDKHQIELIPRFGSAVILFGDDKKSNQKIKELDIFYFDVLRKIGWDYYKVINIMYKDQIVCFK